MSTYCHLPRSLTGHKLNVVSGFGQSFNTPPVLVVSPNQWKLPVDLKVGSEVARVRVTDHENDEVTLSVQKATGHFFGGPQPAFGEDGSKYFKVSKRGREGVVTLSRSLKGKFKPGSKLTLAITGKDQVTSITARTEVYVIVEDPVHHGDPLHIDDANSQKTKDRNSVTVREQIKQETTSKKPPVGKKDVKMTKSQKNRQNAEM